MKNICFLLLLLFSFNSCNNKESFIYDSNSLDSLVSKYVDNGSQALLLVRLEDRNGNTIYQNSDKDNDLVPNHDINENTWFRIWSMSKIVTISLTMDLVEDGLLSLNDPVSKYIPELSNLKVALSNNDQALTSYGQSLGNDNSELQNPCPIKLVESNSEMTVLQLINHEAGFYYSTTGIECLDNALDSKNLAASKTPMN